MDTHKHWGLSLCGMLYDAADGHKGPRPALDMRWWGIYMFVGARPAQGAATTTADNELSFTCGRLQAKNWGKYEAWGESLEEAH